MIDIDKFVEQLATDAIIEEDVPTETEPSDSEVAKANQVHCQSGVRLMNLDGVQTVGVWSDLDGPELRAALRTFGTDKLPLRYLDEQGIPAKFKERLVPGHSVSEIVLKEMHRNPEPWSIRDRILAEIRKATE